MTINERLSEGRERFGILLGKVPYKRAIGATLLATAVGSGVYLHKSPEVRQESANAERQLECYVNAIMEHQFHSKYHQAQYRQTDSNGMDKYYAMETSFLSGRPSSDQNLVRSDGKLLLKLAAEGSALRSELTKKIDLRDGGLKLIYDCK